MASQHSQPDDGNTFDQEGQDEHLLHLKERKKAEPIKIVRRESAFSSFEGPDSPPATKTAKALWQKAYSGSNEIFKYTKIDDDEIRLLVIEASQDPNQPIVGSLFTFHDGSGPNSNSPPDYDALSYNWGFPAKNPSSSTDVFLRDMKEIKTFAEAGMQQIAQLKPPRRRYRAWPNLYQALKQVRPREKDNEHYLWIDAICSNQENSVEKKKQIAKMSLIYTKAVNVMIWLGPSDKLGQSQRAMDHIREICRLQDAEEELALISSQEHTRSWHDLVWLMKSRWFSRRWVIQEIALAKQASVHSGDQEVDWRNFKYAISFLVMHFDNIKDLFRQSREFNYNVNAIGDLGALGAKLLADQTTNILRHNPDGSILEPTQSLETLVCSLSTFESLDPRDTIYALRNISRETHEGQVTWITTNGTPPLYPDYDKDLILVYQEFLDWIFTTSKSLNIICRHWALPTSVLPSGEINKLPSWIRDITDAPFGRQEQNRGRKNGDSLVGLPGHECYTASLRKEPVASFRVTEAQNDGAKIHLLCVKGIQIGTIKWKSGTCHDGLIPKEALRKGGWTSQKEKYNSEVPEKVWRTLVADRDSDGRNPPIWYQQACFVCLANSTSNGNIVTQTLLLEKQMKAVTEYLKRVQCVTWNRRFIEADPYEALQNGASRDPQQHNGRDLSPSASSISTSESIENSHQEGRLFGLGPALTKKNDIICILFGCSVPCILRRRPKDGYYQFIGEAYIFGQMDGEALHNLQQLGGEELIKNRSMEFEIK